MDCQCVLDANSDVGETTPCARSDVNDDMGVCNRDGDAMSNVGPSAISISGGTGEKRTCSNTLAASSSRV